MGWSHPDISLEDLLKLIKGFVDVLILASGYQSSGLHAHWDAHNIRKAFQWGLFFENVFRCLRSLEDFHDSMKELDVALSEMTSNPFFPQGLAHLSSVNLSRGRTFVLERLIHTMPLRDAHLEAFLYAIIEMDLDELCEAEYDCLHAYLDKLRLLNSSLNPLPGSRVSMEDSMITSADIDPNRKIEKCTEDLVTKLTVQELLKRQLTVSCILSAESGLGDLSKMIRPSHWNEPNNHSSREQLTNAADSLCGEQCVEYVTWSCWMSKNLSYLLGKRIVRLVSGGSLIFSAPKTQWVQVFKQMNISSESNEDFCETIEILLLGSIASRWSHIIEYFMSISFDSLAISRRYLEVRNILTERRQSSHCKEGTVNSKLWKLSPVLVAVAIPSWSPLFGLYLSEIENQLKGEALTIRCCTCTQDMKEHKECELAERIWCLHVFHVCGSQKMLSVGTA
ncbi:uncharacterized protein LOC131155075 isoform X2 [Malania oleifera]|uniref:uncharacterized protein LOC131155075 isoform X2 n=1 Tax=Malania oleifera TaxID=397392 RepID=UPI0025AE40EC|nr:uncharacterized protein LOC131155075 isoform X2 [Malania oleifera]